VRVSSCQIGATVLAPLPRAYVNAAHCARFCALPSLSLSLTLSRFSLSLAMALSLQQQRSRRALLQLDNNLAARLLAAHLAAENRHRETHSVGLFVSTAATRRSLQWRILFFSV